MDIRKWSITQLRRLPCICSLCNQYHQDEEPVCGDCQMLFVPLGFACELCAARLPDAEFPICGQCIKNKPAFDSVTAPFRFEDPLRTLMHEFKYNQSLYLSSFLAKKMLKSLPIEWQSTECLVPVPLHPKRIRDRGFNQAAELAKYLAKALNKPYELNLVKKIKRTPTQAGLTGKERRLNLQNVFEVEPTSYKQITIIDDLLTTGSTANELAKALKKKGVVSVDVWCCARASLD